MHLPCNVGARRRLKEGRGRPQERAQASLQVDSTYLLLIEVVQHGWCPSPWEP